MTDTFLTEKVMRIESSKYVCRVWTASNSDDAEVETAATNALIYLEEFPSTIEATTSDLAAFSGINSAEIVDKSSGAGLCVHKNWP
jgi:hypothetical protein